MPRKVISSAQGKCLNGDRKDRGDAKRGVMRRSRSGQDDKVQRARAVVDQALGDAARRDGQAAILLECEREQRGLGAGR